MPDDDHRPPERRDLDDLKDAIRGLNIVVTRLEAALSRGVHELLGALQQIATNTEGLPALLEQLQRRANGTAAQHVDG